MNNIENYNPTIYVNDSSPDLDADNLNKTEQALKRVTEAANEAINALNQLETKKLSVSNISNVQINDPTQVPSSSLAFAMQKSIDDINSDFAEHAPGLRSGDMALNPGRIRIGAPPNNTEISWEGNLIKTAANNVVESGKIITSADIRLVDTSGIEIIFDPNTGACIVKWKINNTLHYQLVLSSTGISYDRWDGSIWNNVWSK